MAGAIAAVAQIGMGMAGNLMALKNEQAALKKNQATLEKDMQINADQTAIKIDKTRRSQQKQKATFRTQAAGSGVSLTEGSYLDVTASQSLDAQRELLNLKYQSDIQQSRLADKYIAAKEQERGLYTRAVFTMAGGGISAAQAITSKGGK